MNATARRHTLILGPTAQASSRHRCIIGGNVLQHHDAGAVIPLYADPAGCLDQVHAACVLHEKGVMGKGKSHRSVVHRHLRADSVKAGQFHLPGSGGVISPGMREGFTLRSRRLMMIL